MNIHASEYDWRTELVRNSYGKILPTGSNFLLIFRNDNLLNNIIFNELTNQIDICGEVPWNRYKGAWTIFDFYHLCLYLEDSYGLYQPTKCKETLLAYLSSEKRVHPIKKYLSELKWDGLSRVERLLIDYLGAEDSEYVKAVTRKTLVAAVARAMKNGVKFDNVLVLCGPQGIGKSTLFGKLGKSWYSDSLNMSDMKDKTAAEKLQGIWIMEIGELAGMKKIDIEILKSFISRTDDKYRNTYGQYVESHPRRGIIVGSTNRLDGFLTDITGNRRFWPVRVSGESICNVWDLSDEDINQIWAESYVLYRQGEPLFLSKSLMELSCSEQQNAMETDPRQGLVEEFLDMYINGVLREHVCVLQIWCECFGKKRSEIKKGDAYDIEAMILKNGKWMVYPDSSSGKSRIPEYGVQKTYIRKETANVF